MKTMKLIIIALMATSLLATISACSKDDDDPIEPELTAEDKLKGFWIGKYGFNDQNPTSGYAMLFKLDGTVRVYDMDYYSDTTNVAENHKVDGTYEIMENQVNVMYASHPSYQFSAEAGINTDFDYMEGSWGANESTEGTFFLIKEE